MKKKYGMTDREKAFRNQAIDYDSNVIAARGCVGGGVGIVFVGIAMFININMSTLGYFVLFLVGLIGVPWVMYTIERNTNKQRVEEFENKKQIEENERRVASRSSLNFANAPTTLIADAIKNNLDIRKNAVRANSYKEFVEIQKKNNADLIIWKKENIKILLKDPRLNVIELDALIKQITELKQSEIRVNKDFDSNKDFSSQLRELKKLLDDGVITQEDFEAKKRQLLNI